MAIFNNFKLYKHMEIKDSHGDLLNKEGTEVLIIRP